MRLQTFPTEFLGHKFAELHTKHNGVRTESPGVWETLGLRPTLLVPATAELLCPATALFVPATALLVPATAPKLVDIDVEGARVDAL